MCHPGFGADIAVDEFYSKFINYFKNVPLDENTDGFTIEYLCAEAYHDIFDLNNFDDKFIVMPVIEYTNADTLGDIGPKAELINEYRNHDMLGRFGLSLKEYLELPVDMAKLLVSRARMEKEDEENIQAMAIKQAEKEARQNK